MGTKLEKGKGVKETESEELQGSVQPDEGPL